MNEVIRAVLCKSHGCLISKWNFTTDSAFPGQIAFSFKSSYPTIHSTDTHLNAYYLLGFKAPAENKTGVVPALTWLILVSGGEHEVISEWQVLEKKLSDTSLTRRPFWNSSKFKYSRQHAQQVKSFRDAPVWGTESLEWPKENGEWSPGNDMVKILPYIQDFISVHTFKVASAVPLWEILWGLNEIIQYYCFYHNEGGGSLHFFLKLVATCDLSSYLLGD